MRYLPAAFALILLATVVPAAEARHYEPRPQPPCGDAGVCPVQGLAEFVDSTRCMLAWEPHRDHLLTHLHRRFVSCYAEPL